MMKETFQIFNPLSQCKKYNLRFWQCPQFLFLIMGLIIIGVIAATYFIGTLKIKNPKLVVLITLSLGGILLVLDYIITNSLEKVVEASRMKTEFICIVSHQLRTPLTNLKFALENLISKQKKETKKEQNEYLEIIEKNAEKMNNLINDLLTVAQIENKRLFFQKKMVSLSEITKKVILGFKSFSEVSNVEIKFFPQKNLPFIFADPLWLKQIIENLLDNAIRYSRDKGKILIKIYQKKKKIYFEIRDKGLGIPKEEQRYIFQKFFRSKNVLKYQTKGTGLGLYISKKIIELMNGKIWFKSKENKGTTFFFSLPLT